MPAAKALIPNQPAALLVIVAKYVAVEGRDQFGVSGIGARIYEGIFLLRCRDSGGKIVESREASTDQATMRPCELRSGVDSVRGRFLVANIVGKIKCGPVSACAHEFGFLRWMDCRSEKFHSKREMSAPRCGSELPLRRRIAVV